MEPLSHLVYLLEPASLALVATAVGVVLAAAARTLAHERDGARHRDTGNGGAAIVLDGPQALLVPLASSASLLLMFYLFAALSHLVTAFAAAASASSLAFCLAPHAAAATQRLGVVDSVAARLCCGSFTSTQCLLALTSGGAVTAWLLTGHWLLNNLLGAAICVAFVAHVRLPNAKTCVLLLGCLFVYDVFWVFFSEALFGANVMVSVATQQARNPIHTVAHSLHVPVPHAVTKKLDLPIKLLFPRDLLSAGGPGADYMMLGLGDMVSAGKLPSARPFVHSGIQPARSSATDASCRSQAIPGMLLALVVCFDYHKSREAEGDKDGLSSLAAPRPPAARRGQYVWYAVAGYAVGLVAALAAGVLTRLPQPALLYLVPSTLGPVAAVAWRHRELAELWHGPPPAPAQSDKDKARLMEV
eukprot:SM000090S24316  [mRNA]  locus=s90:217102:218671:- [translate_table: standard]